MSIRKVLVVDDDEDIRSICELSLKRLGGWEVLLAGSAAEALTLAGRERPDVILLDVMMPDDDGMAVLEKLRAQDATAHVPVIFLAAKVQTHGVQRYHELGAAGVISKPFEVLQLPDEIRRLVGEAAKAPD